MALEMLAVLERAGNGDKGADHGAHKTLFFVDARLLPLVQSQLRSSTAPHKLLARAAWAVCTSGVPWDHPWVFTGNAPQRALAIQGGGLARLRLYVLEREPRQNIWPESEICVIRACASATHLPVCATCE